MNDPLSPPVLVDIRSTEVGTFHPEKKLWEAADHRSVLVTIGQTIGRIELLGLRHNIFAPVEGWLARGDAQPGFPVEYGQVLFRIIQLTPGMATGVTSPEPVERQASAEPEDDAQSYVIRSPIIGVYYAAPAPDAEPYVEVGQHVSVGQPVCVIEAMKQFNEIPADMAGRVIRILVTNGAGVKVDQALVVIATGADV